MKRYLLPAFLGILTLTCSCFEEPVSQETPQAAITYFALGNYHVKFHDFNYLRRDTIVSLLESGNMYPMTIDQIGNRIYNNDSLAYGSELDKVMVNISHTGTVIYRYLDDPLKTDLVWYTYDSLDFTRPIQFSVISTDNSFRRDYSFKLNVRTVFQDSVKWTGTDSQAFPVMDMRSSAIKSDTIFAFGLDPNGDPAVSSRNILSGAWSAASAMNGLTASTWGGQVVSRGERLYTVSGSNLYSSADGINWTAGPAGFRTLFAVTGKTGSVWAVSDQGKLMSSEDMVSWTVGQDLPDGFPEKSVVTSSSALPTNANIIRTVAVGLAEGSANASVWTKLSTDSLWTKVEAAKYSKYLLPAMDRLSTVSYDGALFAFGSGFTGFWQSNDYGTSWQFCDRFAQEYSSYNQYMQMPAELKGYDKGFAYTVDRLGSIWIMTSDGKVWRGAINRLNKR